MADFLTSDFNSILTRLNTLRSSQGITSAITLAGAKTRGDSARGADMNTLRRNIYDTYNASDRLRQATISISGDFSSGVKWLQSSMDSFRTAMTTLESVSTSNPCVVNSNKSNTAPCTTGNSTYRTTYNTTCSTYYYNNGNSTESTYKTDSTYVSKTCTTSSDITNLANDYIYMNTISCSTDGGYCVQCRTKATYTNSVCITYSHDNHCVTRNYYTDSYRTGNIVDINTACTTDYTLNSQYSNNRTCADDIVNTTFSVNSNIL